MSQLTSRAESSIVAAEELRAFVERIEQTEAEKKDAAEAQKGVYAEARGRGYQVKVIRKIIRDRKLSRDALAEFESIEELYRSAVGMV